MESPPGGIPESPVSSSEFRVPSEGREGDALLGGNRVEQIGLTVGVVEKGGVAELVDWTVGGTNVVVAGGVGVGEHARGVDVPRAGEGVGVAEAEVLAGVMGEAEVVVAERVGQPRRNANEGGAVEVVAERGMEAKVDGDVAPSEGESESEWGGLGHGT